MNFFDSETAVEKTNGEPRLNLYLIIGALVSLLNFFASFWMIAVCYGSIFRIHGGENLELLALAVMGLPFAALQSFVLLPVTMYLSNELRQYQISIYYKKLSIAAPIVTIAAICIGVCFGAFSG